MQSTASATHTMQPNPGGCPDIQGQPASGPAGGQPMPGNGGQPMGNEGGMATGQAGQVGSVGPTGSVGQAGSVEPAGQAETGPFGAQYANEIPHWTASGYVQGRPQEVNNPQSAGSGPPQYGYPPVSPQMAPQNGYPPVSPQMAPQNGYHPVSPQTGPTVGSNPGSYGTGPVSSPGQTLVGPAYPGGMPDASLSGPAFPQPGPQFAGPYMPSPGYPPHPSYGSAPQEAIHTGHTGQPHNPADPAHLKHDEHKYGQLMGIVNDLANGNPDVSKMMGLLQSCDTQFWKGTLIGVAATLLLTNETVKNTITNAFSGIGGTFQAEKKEVEK